MKLKLDSIYTIGKTHQVCEDYIIHGYDPVPRIILGDGCSSSPNTDLGARLLVHSANKMIKQFMHEGIQHYTTEEIINMVRIWALNLKDTLGLNSNNFDSTLMVLCKDSDSNKVKLIMMGDGIIITKTKNKCPLITQISYMGEMPYYLSYFLNDKRNQAYKLKAKELEPEGNTKIIKNGYKSMKAPYYDLTFMEYDMDEYEYIIISSDGLDSFYDENENFTVEEIVPSLTDFKSFKGEFLKRRVKRMLKNFEKDGIHHYDDLSIGIMYNENNS